MSSRTKIWCEIGTSAKSKSGKMRAVARKSGRVRKGEERGRGRGTQRKQRDGMIERQARVRADAVTGKKDEGTQPTTQRERKARDNGEPRKRQNLTASRKRRPDMSTADVAEMTFAVFDDSKRTLPKVEGIAAE
eukprot:6196695-Pleurochrysis_carterae.AAC.2